MVLFIFSTYIYIFSPLCCRAGAHTGKHLHRSILNASLASMTSWCTSISVILRMKMLNFARNTQRADAGLCRSSVYHYLVVIVHFLYFYGYRFSTGIVWFYSHSIIGLWIFYATLIMWWKSDIITALVFSLGFDSKCTGQMKMAWAHFPEEAALCQVAASVIH